jgi:hypothetical protein
MQITDAGRNGQLRPEIIFVNDSTPKSIEGTLASRLSIPGRPGDRSFEISIVHRIPGLLISLHEMLEMILRVSEAQDRLRRHGQNSIVD